MGKEKPESSTECGEQKVIQLFHEDAQMRAALINKVAAPIANKMFECGMIPWQLQQKLDL